MKVQRKYGWKPDKRDHRDFLLSEAKHKDLLRMVREMETLPAVVDLRPQFQPIENQDQLGSCTAFAAVGGAFEFLEAKELREKMVLANAPEEFSAVFEPGSKLFGYYNERVIDGDVSEDAGGELRDIVKSLAMYGVCPDKMWPYVESQFAVKPPEAAYQAATAHKITEYTRLVNFQQLKAQLARGYPFIFGIMVYDSFESEEVATSGMVPMPKTSERCVGGHALCAAGYDDSKQCFIIRNSWGTDWGIEGYFYLPYAYLQNPNLASDFWIIEK